MNVRKIQKIGDSLAMIVPAEYCKKLNICKGSLMAVGCSDGKNIVITPIDDNIADTIRGEKDD